MKNEQSSTPNGPSRRRFVRLAGGLFAGVGMTPLAGCGFPGGGEEDDEDDEEGGENGGDGEGGQADD